jgi:predicted HicB family RNase H-like nuclease
VLNLLLKTNAMNNTISFKGFIGSINFDLKNNLVYGKIEGIDDLIMFEGSSVSELKKMFKEAVDDYIEICKQTNKPCMKSFKGSFNVRVKPEIHQRASMIAIAKGISLNQLVQKAIEREIEAA